jgi:hypothetical protein
MKAGSDARSELAKYAEAHGGQQMVHILHMAIGRGVEMRGASLGLWLDGRPLASTRLHDHLVPTEEVV